MTPAMDAIVIRERQLIQSHAYFFLHVLLRFFPTTNNVLKVNLRMFVKTFILLSACSFSGYGLVPDTNRINRISQILQRALDAFV